MTFAVLALASAAAYGAADFIGGISSRRADTIVIVLVSQGAGLLMVLLLLPVLAATAPTRTDWMWSGVAGVTGGVGVAFLYRALAIGRMGVVAPITAVCAVAVPVAIAIVLGERPGWRAGAGITVAILAIILVSQHEQPDPGSTVTAPRPTGIGLALVSGVAIGLFFLALARTSAAAGLWPLFTARVVSVTLFAALAWFFGRSLHIPPTVTAAAVAGGALDMLANLLYLLASRLGPLTLVVSLSSLYPASTVVLARVFLGERLTPRQWVGVGGALVAIVLIVGAS